MKRASNSQYDDASRVILMQSDRLKAISATFDDGSDEDDSADSFLAERGIFIELDEDMSQETEERCVIAVPTWNELVEQANVSISSGRTIDELFSEDELASHDNDLCAINEDFNAHYRLDKMDVTICVLAGIASATVDLFLVGVPHKTAEGLESQPLGNYVRERFEKWFSPEEMTKLEKTPGAKVPYDAPYNMGFTSAEVEGLWPAMHRLYSLGHDPLLGFVVGVHDILNGQMTTIDKLGNVVVQSVDRYSGRAESDLFAALCKQVLHLKTDVNTAMGLPAPLMGLFNLMQFGKIGNDDQTVAEIVQGMYYEGYDFVHFCAQSIPVMLTEVIVRLCYFAKRIHEGFRVKESIPFSLDRVKHPKLATMLFVAHSTATAINAGKVCVTKNPMEINYPQMLTFVYYSISQMKWDLITKPELRHEHVSEVLAGEITRLEENSSRRLEESGYDIVYR